jgi:hypothetical protein
MTEDMLRLEIVRDTDTDDRELSDLAQRLRNELMRLNVAGVGKPAADDPANAKGLGAVLGVLLVQIGSLEPVISVLATIGEWARRTKRTVEIHDGERKLILGNVTAQQQQALIDDWLARRDGSS